MSYFSTSVEEIHILKAKLENLTESCLNFSEILRVSEEIDLMLTK